MDWKRIENDEYGNRQYIVNDLHPQKAETIKGAGLFGGDLIIPDETQAHLVLIPEEAFADRSALYGLSTEDDALTHIMWEHHVRLNPATSEKVLPTAVKANFDRVWGPGHKGPRGLPMTEQESAESLARLNAIRKHPTNRGQGRG